eukprot:TRINITY_DN20746_c0_g1_i2.p1 TRINITY_DN20746_c0_g1~~TRINITY_DN20746_c0_g1_i2.p1  ORF type:complete len:486 (+),score=160.40 TRINITY_DN20746_c0_g1_i2:49-1458(+)
MALPSRRAAAVAAACALYAVQPCDAAGGKSIFKLTDQVDTKAWSVMWMYFVVFVVTIGFEVLVHWLHHTVSSDSGQAVVHHVTQEVMILGGISAVLVVFENSGGGELIDAALFHYVHFVIFLMMILFIFLVSSLFLLVNRSWSRWSQFENGLEDIVGDPSLSEQQRSAFLQQYVRHFPKGRKMIAAYTFFRQNLPERLQQCSLTRYMKKMERKFLLSFVHLHPKSWVLLGGLCAAVAVVTEVTIMISDNELAIISLWILFVGLGPAIVMGVVYYKVRKEFDLFVIGVQEIRAWSLLKPQKSQKHHFWMQKPGFTVTVIQTMLHFQVFFLANAVTNFCYRLSGMMPLGPPIIVMMFVLPLFVFLVMLPITLPPFTILASLGEYIDHKTLQRRPSAAAPALCSRWWRRTRTAARRGACGCVTASSFGRRSSASSRGAATTSSRGSGTARKWGRTGTRCRRRSPRTGCRRCC